MNNEEALKVVTKEMLCEDCNSARGVYCVETNCEASEAIDVIRKALEKQIPKKPYTENYINGNVYTYCPTCNEVVLSVIKDSPIKDEYNHSFCGGCGQKLDWGEEE